MDRGRQMEMRLCWGWGSREHLSLSSPLVPQRPGTPSIVLFDFCFPGVEALDLRSPMGIKTCVRSRVLPHPPHPQTHTLTAPILYRQEPLLQDPKITHLNRGIVREQYGKKGQASDSTAPLPSPVPCLFGETLATPDTRFWPAPYFPCWKLRLTCV